MPYPCPACWADTSGSLAGLVVAQHKGAGLAPWNLENYRFSYRQGRVWVDTDPLLYYHFTRLRVINRWLYDPALWELGQHRPDPIVKRHIYVPYVRELGTAGKLLRAVGGKVHPDDTIRWSRNKLLLLARTVHLTVAVKVGREGPHTAPKPAINRASYRSRRAELEDEGARDLKEAKREAHDERVGR